MEHVYPTTSLTSVGSAAGGFLDAGNSVSNSGFAVGDPRRPSTAGRKKAMPKRKEDVVRCPPARAFLGGGACLPGPPFRGGCLLCLTAGALTCTILSLGVGGCGVMEPRMRGRGLSKDCALIRGHSNHGMRLTPWRGLGVARARLSWACAGACDGHFMQALVQEKSVCVHSHAAHGVFQDGSLRWTAPAPCPAPFPPTLRPPPLAPAAAAPKPARQEATNPDV